MTADDSSPHKPGVPSAAQHTLWQKIVYSEMSLYIAVGLVLFGLLWALSYNTVSAPLMRDEGEYSYSALLLRTGGVPYEESFMQKPPMIIYTYAIAQFVSKDAWAPRALALLSLMCTGLFLFAIIRRMHSLDAALVSAAVFPILVFYPSLEAFSAQPEVFLLLPLVASWWFYFRSRESMNPWLLAGIGACSAIAVLYKPIVAPAAAFLVLYMVCVAYVQDGWQRATRTVLITAAAALVATLVILLPIVLLGALPYLIESAFLYNLSYATKLWMNDVFGGTFLLYTAAVWLLCLWFVVKTRNHRWFFVGLFATLLFGTAGGFMKHYYIICVPALAVMVSVGLASVGTLFDEREGGARKQSTALLLLLFLAVMLAPQYARFPMTPDEALYNLYGDHSFEASSAIASELAHLSAPTDRVFIDGSQPEILYEADRRSATRFVILFPLIIQTAYSAQYDSDVVADLKASPPQAIVTFLIPQRIERFIRNKTAALKTDQYMEQQIHDHYVFRLAIPLSGGTAYSPIYSPNELNWSTQYYVLYTKDS